MLELHGGREFLHAEHEAAVAGDRDHRPVGIGDLGAERGRKARAERALIARGDEGARLVDRKAVPGGEADLRQLVGDDGVRAAAPRAGCSDRPSAAEPSGSPAAPPRWPRGSRRAGRWSCCSRPFSRPPTRSRVPALASAIDGGVGREAAHFHGIDIDADRFQPIRLIGPARHRSAIPAACRSRSSDRCSATACRPPPWSARVHARWRRCRGRCGTPPPARRSSRRVRGFPRAHGSRRCRRRSSAVLLP